MKVVQLGCGITGLVCAEHLDKCDAVDQLVLADSYLEAAEAMVKRRKSAKLSVQKADATNAESVKGLLKDCDLIVSAIPYELNMKVIRLAAEAGVNYVDFSMSMDSEEQVNEIDKLCRDSGITAVTSMGSDPGISDVFAVYASRNFDTPETARVMDGDSGSAEGYEFFTLWSPLEMLEEMTVPAAIYKNGKIEYVPPLNHRQMYEFPEPIGPLPIYNTIHEETFLMSKHIKGLNYADFRIAIDDGTAQVANTLRKIGMHSLKPVSVKGQTVRPVDVVVANMPRPVELIGKVKGYAGIVVEMTGLKDGQKKMAKVWTTMSHERAHELSNSNATGYLVGTGGATCCELMLKGDFDKKGLFVPEQLPADKFVEMLPSKEIEVKEEVSTLS